MRFSFLPPPPLQRTLCCTERIWCCKDHIVIMNCEMLGFIDPCGKLFSLSSSRAPVSRSGVQCFRWGHSGGAGCSLLDCVRHKTPKSGTYTDSGWFSSYVRCNYGRNEHFICSPTWFQVLNISMLKMFTGVWVFIQSQNAGEGITLKKNCAGFFSCCS